MKTPLPVNPLISVGPEVIPLRLQKVVRPAFAAIAVVIVQGGADSRHGNAEPGGGADNLPPAILIRFHRLLEVRIQQQILQAGLTRKGLFNPLQKRGPDNTPPAPQHGNLAVFQVPAMRFGSGLQLIKTLRLAANFGSIQDLAHRIDKRLAIGRLAKGCNSNRRAA